MSFFKKSSKDELDLKTRSSPLAEKSSQGLSPPNLRNRARSFECSLNSDRVDSNTLKSPWFKSKPSSLTSSNPLRHEADGSFFVSANPAKNGEFILFYKHSSLVHSVDLLNSSEGIHIADSPLRFPNIHSLVTFYSTPNTDMQQSDLPCLLIPEGVVQMPRDSTPIHINAPSPPTLRISPARDARPGSSGSGQGSPRQSLVHEYTPVIPQASSFDLISPTRRTSSPARDSLERSMLSHDYVPPSRRCSSPLSTAEHNEYVPIEVDARSYQRLRAVSKGQKQLHMDPIIDSDAKTAGWNAIGLTRDHALSLLQGQPPGSFVIRNSEDYFAAITVVTSDGHYNAHIEKTTGGIHLKKSNQYFTSLSQLVAHYRRIDQADLPCRLLLNSTSTDE